MDWREKDLEDYLFAHPQLVNVTAWIGRQVHTPSGIIDLLGIRCTERFKQLMVVELKATPITRDAILQVCRYASCVSSWAESKADTVENRDFSDVVDGLSPQVGKVVVGLDPVETIILDEANSVDVLIRTVAPRLSFEVSGVYRFSHNQYTARQEYQDKLNRFLFESVKDIPLLAPKNIVSPLQYLRAPEKREG